MYVIDETIPAYAVGDRPLAPLVVSIADEDGNAIGLPEGTTAQVSIYSPTGTDLTGFLTATVDGDEITIEWPPSSVFTTAGRYTLRAKLVTATGAVSVAPEGFVVETPDGWHTLASARDEWRDAPKTDVRLFDLLEIAKGQVIKYAPDEDDDGYPDSSLYPGADVFPSNGVSVPTNYRYAQLMQARNLWNAGRVDPANGGIGEDSFIIQPRPLDWTVRQIIRPKRGVPTIA